MMKKTLIFLVALVSIVNVSAATKKCVVKDYKSEPDYTALKAYDDEITEYYRTATKKKHYTSIKCQKVLVLETPGDPSKVAGNNYDIHSGLGFYYSPLTVQEKYSCVGEIEYKAIICDYVAADASTKTAMKKELAAYISWTNSGMATYINGLVSSRSGITSVTIDMTESSMSQSVKDKIKENSGTTITNSKLASTDNKQTREETLAKSAIDDNKQTKVKLWQTVYTIERTYYPVQKQIILDGDREGDVISINTACPTTSTCKALTGNKLYTDFSMGAGVHDLKVKATWGSLSVASTCGYIIYNGGAEGWYDLLNYRQVDPSKPFPNGMHGLWNTSLFGKEFQGSPITVFDLSATLIPTIRDYNKGKVYKIVKPSNSNYPSDYFQKYGNKYKPAVSKG